MSWNNIVLLVIFVETLLLAIIGAYRLKIIASKKEKNKVKYDLTNVMFYIDPVGEDDYMLRFKYGEDVIFQKQISDSDMYLDPNLPFKCFVKWCEEESNGSIN